MSGLLREIYSFPSLQRYGMGTIPGIHIIGNNGHATLQGVVDKQTDKNLARIRAHSVPSVFSVTHNLQPSPADGPARRQFSRAAKSHR